MRAIRSNQHAVKAGSALHTVHQLPTRLAFHVSEGMILVPRTDILYCSAESNYTHIYTIEGRRYVVSKTLKQVAVKLSGRNFFRIHQSHLVNLEAIVCVTKHDVRMRDQHELPVARQKRKELLKKLEEITVII